jgi:hypothetical protein
MDISKESARSHLFLLRLWTEYESNRQGEWRARVQHVFSGETHTFSACPQLVDVLLELLRGYDTEQQEKVEHN